MPSPVLILGKKETPFCSGTLAFLPILGSVTLQLEQHPLTVTSIPTSFERQYVLVQLNDLNNMPRTRPIEEGKTTRATIIGRCLRHLVMPSRRADLPEAACYAMDVRGDAMNE